MPLAYSRIYCNLSITIFYLCKFLSIYACLCLDCLCISFLDSYTLPISSISSFNSFVASKKSTPYSCNLSKFIVFHIQRILLCLQLPITSIHLHQSCLQRIPIYYDLLQILIVPLYVIDLLSSCLQFCQYFIILI